MREKFNEILEEQGVYGVNAEDILDTVYDMVLYASEETKKNEPYAVNSIERLESAAYEILSLSNDLK